MKGLRNPGGSSREHVGNWEMGRSWLIDCVAKEQFGSVLVKEQFGGIRELSNEDLLHYFGVIYDIAPSLILFINI